MCQCTISVRGWDVYSQQVEPPKLQFPKRDAPAFGNTQRVFEPQTLQMPQRIKAPFIPTDPYSSRWFLREKSLPTCKCRTEGSAHVPRFAYAKYSHRAVKARLTAPNYLPGSRSIQMWRHGLNLNLLLHWDQAWSSLSTALPTLHSAVTWHLQLYSPSTFIVEAMWRCTICGKVCFKSHCFFVCFYLDRHKVQAPVNHELSFLTYVQ